jgi:hypothetical protein
VFHQDLVPQFGLERHPWEKLNDAGPVGSSLRPGRLADTGLIGMSGDHVFAR